MKFGRNQKIGVGIIVAAYGYAYVMAAFGYAQIGATHADIVVPAVAGILVAGSAYIKKPAKTDEFGDV